MSARFRVVHYLNQHFFGIGGEDKASAEPAIKPGAVGPGRPLEQAFGGEAEVVSTITCGDNFFAEHTEEACERLLNLIMEAKPHLLVAGPAFNSGRYGFACGLLCRKVGETLEIPTVTGLASENPGLEYRRDVYIIPTSSSVSGMSPALQAMARLGLKLLRGERLGPAREEGYFPRGVRKNASFEKRAAERGLDMLLAKIGGQPYETELTLEKFDRVPPASPVKELASTTIALVTTAGLIPNGNPDRLESTLATHYGKYPIGGLDGLDSSDYQGNHGGYMTAHVDADPNRAVPLDALRAMEREGKVKKVFDYLYTLAGCSAYYESAAGMGREIARELKEQGVDAVLLTST